MSELIDLLVEVSPSLKVGWVLWFSAGLTLVASFRLARATPLPVTRPLAVVQVARSPAPQKEPRDSGDPPSAPPLSAVSEPSDEDRDRPAKKSRRRRKAD